MKFQSDLKLCISSPFIDANLVIEDCGLFLVMYFFSRFGVSLTSLIWADLILYTGFAEDTLFWSLGFTLGSV